MTDDDKHALHVVVLQSTCSITDGQLDGPDTSVFDCPVTSQMGAMECMLTVHWSNFQQ